MASQGRHGAYLAQTALLPLVKGYDDLEGPCGAWQTLVDHPDVRRHLDAGGRVRIALEGVWFRAHLVPQMADAPAPPEPPC